jgi:predicted dehydrogenase
MTIELNTDLRMAVIGTGALGQHHARILSQIPGVDLVAVAETRPEIGQAVAQKCGARWFADYRDLYDRVDAVSIVVPTFAHFPVASEFLKRGIPVLLEKPLALNADEGRILVKLSQKNDAILQVGHIERFNAATVAAQPYCKDPKYIRCERLSAYPFRSMDIGVVHDLMIHDIDLVLSMIDSPLERVEAFGIGLMGGEQEDAVQARLTFESGCVVDLSASRISPVPRRTMQVWSARGCVNIDFSKPEVTVLGPNAALFEGPSPVQLALQAGADINQLKQDVFGRFIQVETLPVQAHDNLTQELSQFVHCVKRQDRPWVDGQAALQAMIVAGRILDGVARHQWEGHAAGPVGPFARRREFRKVA